MSVSVAAAAAVFTSLLSSAGVEALAGRPCDGKVHAFLDEALLSGGPPNLALAATLGSCACLLDDHTGFTPLHEVANRAGSNARGLVVELVRHYASTLEVDNRGATALHVAAHRGAYTAAAALCEAAEGTGELRSLLSVRDGVEGEEGEEAERGRTALDVAEAAGNVAIARMLVARGAYRSSDASDDSSPVYEKQTTEVCPSAFVDAALLGDVVSMVELLQGQDRAAAQNYTVVHAESCLAPPSAHGRTLLHVAIASSELHGEDSGERIAALLLERGADPMHQDIRGDTPLSMAARADREGAVHALLDGAPAETVNKRNQMGRTPLHDASKLGASGAARALLMHGADPEIVDLSGFTPVDYARRNGYSGISDIIGGAQELREAGLEAIQNSVDFAWDSGSFQDPADQGLLGVAIGIAGAITLACICSVVIWRCRSSGGSKTAISPMTTYEKEAAPTGDELRKLAAGRGQLFRADAPSAQLQPSVSKLQPPGSVPGQEGASSEDDSSCGVAPCGSPPHRQNSRRRRRGGEKRHAEAAHKPSGEKRQTEATQPSVVVVPHRSPDDDGIDITAAAKSSNKKPLPAHLVAQLRTELRQKDAPQPAEKGSRAALAAMARTARDDDNDEGTPSNGGGSPATRAHSALGRLPTPPMDTTEPEAGAGAAARRTRGTERHGAKRIHGLPEQPGGGGRSGDNGVPLPAALRDDAPPAGNSKKGGSTYMLPAALRDDAPPAANSKKGNSNNMMIPAALRDDPPAAAPMSAAKKGRRS